MIPSRAKQQLANYGVRWVEVPTLLEYDPDLANKRATGWDEFGGGSYAYIAATYAIKRNEVLVAEHALRRDGSDELRGHRLQTTLHETGHAFDWCLGRFSTGDEFRAAYAQDTQTLTAAQRGQLAYFLQSDDKGPGETFAQLFAESVNKQVGKPAYNKALVDLFPNCFRVVLRQVQ
jgi:hypothetical protein